MLKFFWNGLGGDPLETERVKVAVCFDLILARTMCHVYVYVCPKDRFMC